MDSTRHPPPALFPASEIPSPKNQVTHPTYQNAITEIRSNTLALPHPSDYVPRMNDQTPIAPALPPSAPPKEQKLTPAHVPNYRQELRPLPLRVAHSQYNRLVSARNRTGISIQEHVRRAIDVYLAVMEKEAMELGLMAMPPAPENPLKPPQTPRPPTHEAQARPRVGKR